MPGCLALGHFAVGMRHNRHTQRNIGVDTVAGVVSSACMDLKSKREAAELIGVSTRGIERAVRRGQLAVIYRDSKHGKKAWFNAQDLGRYKRLRQAPGPMGFTSGIPRQSLGTGPTVGALIPMVELEARHRKESGREANAVPLADRLTLTVDDAVRLSGLPRSFILHNIHEGKLKAIRIGRRHYVKRSDLNQFVHEL
jgi:excisionase family DNA binding protein